MDYKLLWEEILTRLSSVIGKAHMLSFFKDCIISGFADGVLTIAAPTHIGLTFVKSRYDVRILQVARDIHPDIKEIRFEIQGSLADSDHPDKVDIRKFSDQDLKKSPRKVPGKPEVLLEGGMRSKMLNARYRLSNFIPGNENRLAHAACMAVAAKPGNIYNPLFLYGDVGLGKTHLLQATGIEILRNHPGKNVVYMTSERFINEIVAAIGKRHTGSFKDRYRKVDCLIVDDIQFFGNKATSQQEFFHTFNELYDGGKQIIISSDRPPKELDALEERLKSRFGMGMVVEVQLPDFETRLAILQEKCREFEMMVDPEVLQFIAYNVHHSIRELEGVLVKAIAEAQLSQTTPTIKLVAEHIRRLNRDEELQGVSDDVSKRMVVRSPDDVIDLVANYFKLTKSDITGEDRRKEVMIPRQISMYLIRELLDHSYETIGESFGGRNHTTVLHSCNKILLELDRDSRIKRDINALKREIGA